MIITNDVRKRAIEAYINGHKISQIASMFGIKKPALYAIINIYKFENRVTKKLKGGNRKKPYLENINNL